jgi:hypothetical protein
MTTLTAILRHFSPAERMERRRRINAIADWWALYLVKKYGLPRDARARCVKHQVSTAKGGAGLRNHIWGQVAQQLKGSDR